MAQGPEDRVTGKLPLTANPQPQHVITPTPPPSSSGEEVRSSLTPESNLHFQLNNQQKLARLIAKPSQLKELCQITDEQITSTTLNDVDHSHSNFQLNSLFFEKQPGDLGPTEPARLGCLCQKRRFIHQKIATVPAWVFSSESSEVQHHLPDCPFRSCVASAKQSRWEIRFAGLRRLISCAVGLSFSTSFGAGGFSLSPNFTYYPSVNSSTAPVFRILDLLHWFLVLLPDPNPFRTCPPDQKKIEAWAESFLEFIDLCVYNIIFLYTREKAAPRAIDEYGRSVLHHLSRSQVRHLRDESMSWQATL